MQRGLVQQEAIRRRRATRSRYAPPPTEWTRQQCRLYLCILHQYVQTYGGCEAVSRADACLDRVFCQWARECAPQHRHRRAYLKQIRSYLRAHVDVADVAAAGAASDIDALADTYMVGLCDHLAALPEIAEDTVYDELDTSDAAAAARNIDELLAAVQSARRDWHEARGAARRALRSATQARDFEGMARARDTLDAAEQMCLYYGHVATRTRRDVDYCRSRQRAMALEEATVVSRGAAADNEADPARGPAVAAAAAADAAAEPVQSPQQEADKADKKSDDDDVDDDDKKRTHAIVATATSNMLDKTSDNHDTVCNVDLIDHGEASVAAFTGPFLAFLHADARLAPAERHLMGVLAQYVDASNPLLHRFAPAVERASFVDAAQCVPDSPILSVIANLSRRGQEQRSQHGALETLVGDATRRLADVPFVVVRGTNDVRAQAVREQAAYPFNNVCGTHVDADVLRGVGRAFTFGECQAPHNVCRLFLAEPGCFRVARFVTSAERGAAAAAAVAAGPDNVVVRVAKPHITLSHDVLAPGSYVLDRTIYLAGIDRGRAVALRSHRLHADGEPVYGTAQYDGARVEALVQRGAWQQVHDLRPTRLLHAGNATVFVAATATHLEPLGFAVAGCAGRCLLNVPNVRHRHADATVVECATGGGGGGNEDDGAATAAATAATLSSAYVERDHGSYTQTTYEPQQSYDDALYVDALCGRTNLGVRPRGVGYFLMAHTLAYHARARPSGVLMPVRRGVAPLRSTVDASVAFYYYTHFGMQCVAHDVAQAVGFDALRAMYDGETHVRKTALKRDGVYVHVRNILSSTAPSPVPPPPLPPPPLRSAHTRVDNGNAGGNDDAATAANASVSLDVVCGNVPDTTPYHFVRSSYVLAAGNGASAAASSHMMFRLYPHAVELQERVAAHFASLNGTALDCGGDRSNRIDCGGSGASGTVDCQQGVVHSADHTNLANGSWSLIDGDVADVHCDDDRAAAPWASRDDGGATDSSLAESFGGWHVQ